MAISSCMFVMNALSLNPSAMLPELPLIRGPSLGLGVEDTVALRMSANTDVNKLGETEAEVWEMGNIQRTCTYSITQTGRDISLVGQ